MGAALLLLLRQYVWLSGLCLADADDLIPALVVAGGLEGAGEEAPVPGIDIARFGGSINIIHSRHTFESTSVLEQMQRTLEVFDTYYAYEEIVGFERITKTLVPREAFREAIANALVHRCWNVRANIKVGMFADRIEITSPGGLPAGTCFGKAAADGCAGYGGGRRS